MSRKINNPMSLKQNGIVSALPYLAMWLFSIVFSVTADYVRRREILSTTSTRKIFTTIGYSIVFCTQLLHPHNNYYI